MWTKLGSWILSAAVIIGLSGLSGCSGQSGGDYRTFDKNKDKAPDAEHGHAHSHEHGPHGGELIELGEEEYHAEVVFDEESHKVTLYLLGADAKSAVAIEAKEFTLELPTQDKPQTYTLAAAAQDADVEGKSSRFEITSEELVDAYEDQEGLVGKFTVKIGSKSFTGEVKHTHHGDMPGETKEKAEK